MSKIVRCEECGIEYYSETIVPRVSFRHVYPDIVKLETELADARAEIERKDALIEQMRDALRLTADEYSLHVSRYENRNAHDDPCYIAAEQALAAERGE